MTGEGVPIRRCPDCGEEYLPHIVRCADCDALLEAGFEGDDPAGQRGEAVEPAPPSSEYTRILDGVAPAVAERAAHHLSAAEIPVGMEIHPRYGMRLRVKVEDAVAARAVLEREGIVPEQPADSEPAVAAEGGPCPACGEHVAPGTAACAGCGLGLAGGVPCAHCGAEMASPSGECPECGKEQD